MPLNTGWVCLKNAIEMVYGYKIEKDELADGTLEVVHKRWNDHFQRALINMSLFTKKEISSDLITEFHP